VDGEDFGSSSSKGLGCGCCQSIIEELSGEMDSSFESWHIINKHINK
jgi:hypothetical protein